MDGAAAGADAADAAGSISIEWPLAMRFWRPTTEQAKAKHSSDQQRTIQMAAVTPSTAAEALYKALTSVADEAEEEATAKAKGADAPSAATAPAVCHPLAS